MLAAPVGLWWLWKRFRAPALVAGAVAAYYFLFNASFYWWKAGLSFGPRYAGACIPLLCLGLGVSWSRATVGWRRVLIALACCSVFVTVMVVSTSSQLAMQDRSPIVHSSWPAFWAGDMASNRESMLMASEAGGRYAAFNLGQLVGLHGMASLSPLVVMWGVVGGLVARILRKSSMGSA